MSVVLQTIIGRYMLPVRVAKSGHDGYVVLDANDQYVEALNDGDLAELLVSAMNETPIDPDAVIVRSSA